MCRWRSHDTKPKLYDKIKVLLQKKTADANCCQAVLYIYNIIPTIRQIGEEEFMINLYQNFYPVKTPKYGDLICLMYYDGVDLRCQHVFMRITDRLVFHKAGPNLTDMYEITSLRNVLARYKARIMEWLDEITVSNLMLLDAFTLCFRMKT